ncbi:hypothetical protein A6V39_01500 [Candidatus Mycoplasma haematobovis]|uniref:NIF system FeS cluster assembly NifU N-terminal domain-containing protein n=1 Tax=Candidatus Mycoplasma haematobovis TaxID=432608 RepID=A0A1A9QFD7_9MOLU|nr:iron-sulfur cluster assembly scaffold protein [Candidatus Mycoplasma haematobovis]OAL10721.1 hypothetical protein A6V39_01500 [Candidatus Mycoplasma haematobovis]
MGRSEIFKFSKVSRYISKEDKPVRISTSACDDWCSITFSKDSNIVSNLKFSHNGCILSRASINVLMEEIENKTVEEANAILKGFKNMILGKQIPKVLSEKLLEFKKFSKYSSRHACLLLGCDLMLKILNES